MKTIHVIACGVLAVDLKHVAHQLGLAVELQFLPGGLHSTPELLRERLQEAIDASSVAGDVERIVIGYGVCGRGAVGLRARGVPLVIPRVHDCIALFLGSDARYREEFARNPGTYYISAGWVEEKGDGMGGRKLGSDGSPECCDEAFRQLVSEYGDDQAEYIRNFLDSWKRNYSRAAFIDSGVGEKKQRYERIARRMAEEFGWQYEQLKGSHELLIKALTTATTTDEILVVPPNGLTEYDGVRRRLFAVGVEDGGAAAGPPGAPSDASAKSDSPSAGHVGVGLGIDAGGTYTDAVLFDLGANRLIAKAKALTTPWDFTLGIHEALSRLPAASLPAVQLVAVSTTLATNAIVEGRGQTTGLLVMPPYGWRDVTGFTHAPMELIDGYLEIDGRELQPISPGQVRRIARRMVDEQGVSAFAVGGYASHANPAHELAVKAIIEDETGLGVTCGHELSEGLHYRVRAETAALNARIIPCLRALLDRLTPALAAHGVHAPVMVVRSDGSLMNLDVALERPLETMLSGPAASVAGAVWLAGRQDALVVDVGGTTTDTALVRNGIVELCDKGATIGGWQTHIRALNLRTLGLGGDSRVRLERGSLRVGPDRVGPICWLASSQAGTATTLAWIEERLNAGRLTSEELTVYARVGGLNGWELTADEQRLVELLDERPRSALEAALALGKPHHSFVPWSRLLERHIVLRCALTPTDALHAAGIVRLWDADAGARVCRWYARLARQEPDDFVRGLLAEFEHRLAAELLKKQMAGEVDADGIDAQPIAQALVERALHGYSEGYRVRIELRHPVVGVGAPAGCFVPGAARLLNATAIVPEHADVANAIGAITGSVSFRRRVVVSANEQGLYRLGGVPDAPVFANIDDATEFGADYLRRVLMELARNAGAESPVIRIDRGDSTSLAAGGEVIFIDRTLEATASGRPNLRSVS